MGSRSLTARSAAAVTAAMAEQRYRVEVASEFLRFGAAHFIAFPGFREPLHGHNYQMSVRVDAALSTDGYVIDFCRVKGVAEALCRELTERTIVPERSDCMRVEADGAAVASPRRRAIVRSSPRRTARCCRSSTARRRRSRRICWAGCARRCRRSWRGGTCRAIAVGVAEAPGQVAWCEESC